MVGLNTRYVTPPLPFNSTPHKTILNHELPWYQVCVVGDDNDVARAAIVLYNLGAMKFKHTARIGKLNCLEYTAGKELKNVHVMLHKHHIKTRRYTFKEIPDAKSETDVRDGAKDTSRTQTLPIKVGETNATGDGTGSIG